MQHTFPPENVSTPPIPEIDGWVVLRWVRAILPRRRGHCLVLILHLFDLLEFNLDGERKIFQYFGSMVSLSDVSPVFARACYFALSEIDLIKVLLSKSPYR